MAQEKWDDRVSYLPLESAVKVIESVLSVLLCVCLCFCLWALSRPNRLTYDPEFWYGSWPWPKASATRIIWSNLWEKKCNLALAVSPPWELHMWHALLEIKFRKTLYYTFNILIKFLYSVVILRLWLCLSSQNENIRSCVVILPARNQHCT